MQSFLKQLSCQNASIQLQEIMEMDRKGGFCNKLTETSSNCITKTLAAVKQILLEAQKDCQHVSAEQQATGANQPSSKFKGILLILKEILMQTINNPDTRHSGFTLPEYIESRRSCDFDSKISSVCYGLFKNLVENLEECDDVELVKRHVVNKSLEYTVGVFESMKHQLASIQPETRGKLDVESYDLLLYVVVCVRQLKEELKQRIEELSALVGCRGEMFGESGKLVLVENKKNELIKDLTCDLACCYEYLNEQVNPDIAQVFEMLIKELQPKALEQIAELGHKPPPPHI